MHGLIHLLVQHRTKQKHLGWSAGYCVYCRQLEALQVQHKIRTVSICFFPVSKKLIGKIFHCDFCQREIPTPAAANELAKEDWLPRDGFAPLLKRLNLNEKSLPAKTSSDVRLHSLLKSVEEATAVRKLDLSWGILIGIAAGFAIGIPLGMAMFHRGIDWGMRDEFGFTLTIAFASALACGIVGAIIGASIARSSVAVKKLRQACQDYQLDLRRLDELSAQYSTLVQRSVRQARDEMELGFRITT